MATNTENQPAKKPISVLMLMRLFPGMMPLYDLPPRPPEGMPPLYKLFQGLEKAGHKVYFTGVVNPSVDAIPKRGDPKTPFEVDGVQYYLLRLPYHKRLTPLRWINPLKIGFLKYKYLRLAWQVSTLIRRIKPDVLYVGGPYHFIGGWCGRLLGVPTVLRFYGVHNLWEIRNRLSSYHENPWAMLSFRTPFNLAIITNDGTQGDKVASSFHVPPEKVRFWVNGVDKNIGDAAFDREAFLKRLGVGSSRKIILCVDRLQNWKRQDKIIRSMPRVVAQVPEALLVLVGDGPERRCLEDLAHSLKVEHQVLFSGAVSHTEVFSFMRAADMYVSVQDVANLNNGILEALLCGLPVVSLDDGSFDGLLSHNREIVLLEPDDKVEAQLSTALVDLLEDEPRRARLAAAAQAFAQTKLDSWEERIAREIAELETLAQKRKSN